MREALAMPGSALGGANVESDGEMTTEAMLWRPSAERIARANITEFARRAASTAGRPLPDYASLWRWSTEEREAFFLSSGFSKLSNDRAQPER